jgi:hypothetical protein
MKWLPFIKTLHLADWITRDRKPRRFMTAAAHPMTYGLPHTQANPCIGFVWPEFPDHWYVSIRNANFRAMRTLREPIEVGTRMPDIVGVRADDEVQRRAWPGTSRKASNK